MAVGKKTWDALLCRAIDAATTHAEIEEYVLEMIKEINEESYKWLQVIV